ncbi:VOC family protein [Sphingomonas sp.]|uniref:VOC family protein n=1 Tax=Sphingomonas sp. TaxID=28214 RepID=UPI003B003F10
MNAHGTPIWYELMTGDPDAATRFYAAVTGWRAASGGMAGIEYRILSDDAGSAGGMMPLPEPGATPAWHVYFGVDDVGGRTAQAVSLGASVLLPPADIPGVGRFAFLADPQGARFYLMRGDGEADSDAFSETARGRCAWNELRTADQDAALGFYGTLLGLEKAGAMPMGELGDYSFLTLGGRPLGAMMTAPAGQPPAWTFYFRVPDIDTAKAAVEAGGGTVRNGPSEVPGGDFVVQAADGQGAAVGFVGKRGAA